MKTDQIFIGDIRKCTKYNTHTTFSSSMYIGDQCIGCNSFGYVDEDDELYKENAVLIKVKNGGYVDLENFNSILDYIKIHQDITKNGYRLGGLIMSTSAHCVNCLFVDRKSLKPYYTNKEQDNNISVHQLKKQINNNSNK